MKKKKLYIVLAYLLPVFLTGCEEEKVASYVGTERLYFSGDSVAQSFFILPDEQMRDTVWVSILTMGYSRKQDRPIRLVQANAGEPGAAVAGKHFLAFDSEEMQARMSIQADSVRRRFPVVLLRDESLNDSQVRLVLKLEENDYFQLGMENKTQFLLKATAQPECPASWYIWQYYLGDWGPVKMWFLMRYVGITEFDPIPGDNNYITAMQIYAAKILDEYNSNEANPDRPLREADGTLVDFPRE